jgi:hypothetical protein
MTASAVALEPELIEHEVDAAMKYFEIEWWLERAGSPRGESLTSTCSGSPLLAPCPGQCGRTCPEAMAMCELCWQHVPPGLRQVLFAVWRHWQEDPGNPQVRQKYRACLGYVVDAMTSGRG